MGNTQYSSPFTVHEELVRAVEREELIQLNSHANKVDVSMQYHVESNPYRHLYTIMLNRQCPGDCRLLCVFPEHPLPKHRILDTARYTHMHELGIELNNRILQSKCIYFFVLCGNQVFKIADFSGNIYLVWCTYVNQSNRADHTTQLARMMPALCEMDGYGRGKNFVLLDPEHNRGRVMQISSLRVLTPFRRVMLWPCERQPQELQRPKLVTFSEPEAIGRVTTTVLDSVAVVPAFNPLVATDSDEECDSLEFVSQTPRIQNPLT